MRWLQVACLLLFFLDAQAQEDLNRCEKITQSTLITNERIIFFESIRIADLPDSLYRITALSSSQFSIETDSVFTDSLEVCYTVLPTVFSKVYLVDPTRYYDSTALFEESEAILAASKYVDKRQELFDMGELKRSGQISRGFSSGNTQNLSVNSTLNLNLEGKLSEDLNIKASITDQDIPFQPEGNTQQLQDFDKVFIQLFNKDFSVIGGDVVLENGDTRFLKYRKNVLGGTVDYFTNSSVSTVGASSAKGQFASKLIEIKEGVYGPYKIPPPDKLSFAIIIANSEKVYLDGKQLLRGYDNDYIIDYNQAEIEFTSTILLTKYSRIRVDYEYAVQNYARSIITASHTQNLKDVKLGVNFYQEKDNENKSLIRELSNTDKQILSNAGDSLQQAIVPGETLSEFSENKIFYYKRDTLVNGVAETIFSHTTQILTELYTVQFTNVGLGEGNYQIAEYLAQGRVYQWVGDGNGSYVPFILLAAPNKKQMLAITGETKLGEFSKVYFETAFSQLDKNLYSNNHSEDNNGEAIILGATLEKLPVGSSNYRFSSTLETEYLSKNFTVIDRFRRVEFDRDWGINSTGNGLGEQDINVNANLVFEKDVFNFINYTTKYRSKENTVNGFQHQMDVAKTLGILQVRANTFLMDGSMPTMVSRWRKFDGEVFLKGKLKPGYKYILEQNTATDNSTDSIISSKNYFYEHQFFIRGNMSSQTQFEILYAKRFDKLPQNGELKNVTEAETVTARIKSQINSYHSLNVALNYRNLSNSLQLNPDIQSVSGRLDWIGEIIPKSIRNELNYTIANSRVPKREYVFIEVPTGEGTHTWRDENEDGIKDLDEFYEAFNYDEKRYIKLYVPSNEFVDAFENRFNYRLSLQFPLKWRQEKGVKKFAHKFSNTTSWTTQYSTTEENLSARLIPFIADIDTSKLLSARESFRSILFINKNNPEFGINIGYLSKSRKVLYTNGFEGRKDLEYSSSIRWNVKRQFQIEMKGLLAERASNSDYLNGRNYKIKNSKLGPTLAWQPNPTLRVTTTYNYGLSEQISDIEMKGYSLLNEVSSELRVGTPSKFVFNAMVKYINIEFNGKEQSPVGYELLKGLRPGNNFSVVLSWQQRLVNGLQIQLFYEGRKPENVAIIHSMRAGISALF
jgi:hypothetical protein